MDTIYLDNLINNKRDIRNKKVNILAICETSFHKRIITHIISKYFYGNSCVILEINKQRHKFNLSNTKDLFHSISYIPKIISKLRGLEVANLISPFISSENILFVSSIINSQNKILIDDGIGTIIKLTNYGELSYNYKIKKFLIKVIAYYNGINLLDIKSINSFINRYYTIYNSQLTLPKIKINPFPNSNNDIIDEVGIIGQPLVENSIITFNKFKTILEKIIKREGNIYYFPHPGEEISKFSQLDKYKKNIDIKKPDKVIENYFIETGFPKKIIGFYSSALFNISNICNKTNIYFIDIENEGNIPQNIIKELLVINGIKKYNI